MGLREDIKSREGLIASMRDVQLKQFLFLRNLAEPVLDRFGEEGLEALRDAFRSLGEWRGRNIRRSVDTLLDGRDALAMLRNWDSGDFALASLDGPVRVEGTVARAKLSLPYVLGAAYFKGKSGAGILDSYWHHVLTAMAKGYDAALSISIPDGSVTMSEAWVVDLAYAGAVRHPGVLAPLSMDVFSEPKRALRLVQQSSRNNGALYMFIARETLRRFDAAGEQAIREGIRGIGRERGLMLRSKHEREGQPLNLRTLMLDWDGPLVSTWVFENDGYLSEGTWHQDCIYCPYADVWAEYGPEGLALGYIYDMELHTTMYQTYYPGVRIQWEALKTRGDHVCKFRFSIPELATEGDPQFTPHPRDER